MTGALTPSAVNGRSTGTAEKNCIVIRARKSGATFFSVTVKTWPLAE